MLCRIYFARGPSRKNTHVGTGAVERNLLLQVAIVACPPNLFAALTGLCNLRSRQSQSLIGCNLALPGWKSFLKFGAKFGSFATIFCNNNSWDLNWVRGAKQTGNMRTEMVMLALALRSGMYQTGFSCLAKAEVHEGLLSCKAPYVTHTSQRSQDSNQAQQLVLQPPFLAESHDACI